MFKPEPEATIEGSSRCKCIGEPCLLVIIVFSHLKTLEKTLRKVNFCNAIMAHASLHNIMGINKFGCF